MTKDKRKAQQREASKNYRDSKKVSGLVDYRRKIKPEWKHKLDIELDKLRGEE